MLIIGLAVAKPKNRFDPIAFEFVMLFCPIVPNNEVYVPACVALPETELNGLISVGLATEIPALVKFPAVTNDQYSVVLLADKEASVLPPGLAAKASARAVMVPVPVVGFSNVNG